LVFLYKQHGLQISKDILGFSEVYLKNENEINHVIYSWSYHSVSFKLRAQITIHRREPIGKPPPLENFSSLSQYIGKNGFMLSVLGR